MKHSSLGAVNIIRTLKKNNKKFSNLISFKEKVFRLFFFFFFCQFANEHIFIIRIFHFGSLFLLKIIEKFKNDN